MRNNCEADRTDTQLIRLVREQPASRVGKEAASRLLGQYREHVFRWCLSRVRDPDLALDLSQDVLLNAYRKLDTFDGRARFSSWIFAIARNRCLNALRRPPLLGEEDELDRMPDPRVGQDLELEQREDEERILRLIREELPLLDQKVLWLRCFEKVPVDAITKMLHITDASGARGVLQRARRRLKAAMAKQADTERGERDE